MQRISPDLVVFSRLGENLLLKINILSYFCRKTGSGGLNFCYKNVKYSQMTWHILNVCFFLYSDDSLLQLVTYHNCCTKIFLWCVSLDLLLLSHSKTLGSYGKPPLIFLAEFIFAISFTTFYHTLPPTMEQFWKFSPDQEKFTRLSFFLWSREIHLIEGNSPYRKKCLAAELGRSHKMSVSFLILYIHKNTNTPIYIYIYICTHIFLIRN